MELVLKNDIEQALCSQNPWLEQALQCKHCFCGDDNRERGLPSDANVVDKGAVIQSANRSRPVRDDVPGEHICHRQLEIAELCFRFLMRGFSLKERMHRFVQQCAIEMARSSNTIPMPCLPMVVESFGHCGEKLGLLDATLPPVRSLYNKRNYSEQNRNPQREKAARCTYYHAQRYEEKDCTFANSEKRRNQPEKKRSWRRREGSLR